MKVSGKTSLTRVYSAGSSSNLPPLKSPSSANPRAFNLELQKTRAAVMDTIQSEANGRARGNQSFESNISLAEHEFTPKIHTLERQSAFTKKQLASLLAHIAETQGTMMQNIKNSHESSKLQFEQQIKQDSVSKLNPIIEDQRLQSSKIQKLTENIVSFLSKNADSIRNVQNRFEQIDKDVSDFNKVSMTQTNDISPRISVGESKVSYLETTAENFTRIVSQTQDMINSEKKCRETLKQIEDEGLGLAVSQSEQETLSLVSSKTIEIDQKIFAVEATADSLMSSLEAGKQAQSQQDVQVEEMSRKSMELEALLKTDEDEILGKLVSLQQQLDEVKTKIMGQIGEQNESNIDEQKFNQEDFQENVQRLSVLSAKDITQLQGEWNTFIKNNSIAQDKANEIIEDALNKLHGSDNILGRVSYQEERIKWCMQRIESWERDDAKRKRAGFDDGEAMVKRIDELEQKLKDFEAGLEAVDGQKAVIDELEEIPASEEMPEPPTVVANDKALDELKVDPSLVLTYPADAPPFEPLKKTKEDEERANERLRKIQQQKEKKAAKAAIGNIDDDFIDAGKPEAENETKKKKKAKKNETPEEEDEEEKPKKKKAKAKKAAKEEEEDDDEEEEEKPKKKKAKAKKVVKDEEEEEEEEKKPKKKKAKAKKVVEEEDENDDDEKKDGGLLSGTIKKNIKGEGKKDEEKDDSEKGLLGNALKKNVLENDENEDEEKPKKRKKKSKAKADDEEPQE